MIIHRHDATALILIILIALFFPPLPSGAFPYFPQDIGDSQPPPQPAVLAQNVVAKDKSSSGVVEKSQQVAEQQQKQSVIEDQKGGGADAEEGSRAPSSTTSIGMAKVESGERNAVSVEEVEELREPLDVVRGVITQIQESAEGEEAEEGGKPFHAQMDIQQPPEDGGHKEKTVEPVERARLIHPSPATPNNEDDDDGEEDMALSSPSSSPPSNGSKIVGDEAVTAPNGDEEESIKMDNAQDEKEGEFGKINPAEEDRKDDGRRVEDEGRDDGRMADDGRDGKDGRDDGRMGIGDDGRREDGRVLDNVRDVGRGRMADDGRDERGRMGEETVAKGRGGPPVPLPPADEEMEDEEDEEEGKKKLSMWDKFVLGIRCARQDCRDTLVVPEGAPASRPRVIDGRWKITRRARASENEEANRLCQCKDIELF